MKDEFLTRQWDLLPPDKTKARVTVIGAGAIGSQVVLCLAKMGFKNIDVWDNDEVNAENVNCQWYGPEDAANKLKKVTALRNIVKAMSGVEITPRIMHFDEKSADTEAVVVIAAVDSMEARKMIWERVKRFFKLKYFIDPRMSAEEGAIYTVNMEDEKGCKSYEKSLYTDGESVSEACTAKATMYCAMLLGGQVAKNVKDIVVDEIPAKTILWNIRKNAVQVFQPGVVT